MHTKIRFGTREASPRVRVDARQDLDSIGQVVFRNNERRSRRRSLQKINMHNLHSESQSKDRRSQAGWVERLLQIGGQLQVKLRKRDQVRPHQTIENVQIVAELFAAIGPAASNMSVGPLCSYIFFFYRLPNSH